MNLQIRNVHLANLFKKQKRYQSKKLIGFSEKQMYNVVSDIQHYQHFLPFCKKSTILHSLPDLVYANLVIGFPPVIENYTSKVTLIENKLVHSECNDGRVFNYLESTWKFAPGLISNEQSCIVDYNIKFEFRSILHTQLATMFFDSIAKQMENAFFYEAQIRYGKESMPTVHLTTQGNS